jgi:hypothetical protein
MGTRDIARATVSGNNEVERQRFPARIAGNWEMY